MKATRKLWTLPENGVLQAVLRDDPDAIERGQKINFDGDDWEMSAYNPETRELLLERADAMSRSDIVKRRFEAKRMRWPEQKMMLIQAEMLILAWSKLMAARRSKK